MRRASAIAGLFLTCAGLFGQEPPENSTAGASQSPAARTHQPTRCDLKAIGQCFKDVAHDQAGIWTSPLRLKSHDALWLVPFAGATGAAFAYDQDALRQVGTTNQTLTDRLRSGCATCRPRSGSLWCPLKYGRSARLTRGVVG